MVLTSFYYIIELDVDTERFKEMTVFDLDRGAMAVIDLTLPQAEMLQRLKVQDGNIVLASCIASVAKTGLTEEWQLLNIHDVCHIILSLEELENLLI